ncbi:MAG: hypothetical protein QOD86_23 [Miltoncostaeaceae bacterium]|nr:hypothetical protein [Miltoncostaeaceae bacterium]
MPLRLARRAHRAAAPAALITAVAALGAAPAAWGASATLAVQNDRLSSSPVETIQAEADRVAEVHAKATRFDILWSLVAHTQPAEAADPADPAYDWSRIDAIMRALGEDGIVPIVTVYSAPPWAANGRPIPEGTEVNPSAPNAVHFGRFMEAVARRYSGSYTPPGATAPLPEIRHFEIWNEPNLGAFFSPQSRGGRRIGLVNYGRMLRDAYPRIKRVNKDAVVIAGVGGPTSSTAENRTSAEDWVKGVVRTGAPFDAYSQHVYPSRPPNKQTIVIPSWSNLGSFLDALDRVPRTRGKALYITEAGYTTAATEFRDVKVTPQQQAAYLNQIMRLPIVRSGRIPAIVWFNLRDNVFWPGGLLNEDFTPKPSYAVFSRLAARTPLHPQLRPAQTRFTLSARQLLINQRISQAAVRRANAVQAKLDRTLSGEDIRSGALGPEVFGGDITTSGVFTGVESKPFDPVRKLRLSGRRGEGDAAGVKLEARQLLISQRISQAAVRRANGLTRRMDGNLTGGDLVDGSITARNLADGLTIARARVQGEPSPPSTTPIVAGGGGSGQVELSINQLRINQRIAQAAVRRTNDLIATLESGLTGEAFMRGSITPEDLEPPLRK